LTRVESRIPDPMDAPPVRWGILGAGSIARAFAYAVGTGTRSAVTAVGSRDRDKAVAFAAEHDAGHGVGSYEELVDADDVDIVYVATPHSAHHENALLALRAGKPVLVEKAFTRNAVEAAQIVDEARSRRLLCMEAMWSRFLPHYDVVRQLIETGRLGSVRTLTADHGQRLWPEGPQRLSDPGLAGGALLDLGIYPVSFAHMVLGGLQHVRAVGTLTDAGVDATTSIVATGRDGAHALLGTTMGARTPTTATISGDLGRIEIDGDFYMPNTVRLLDSGGAELERWEYDLGTRHFGLRFEAAEAGRCLHAGALESPLLPLDETLSVMRTLDEVRAQIGVHYPGE